MFFLYSIILFPEVSVIMELRIYVVNWSKSSSIIKISIWPYLIADSILFAEELKDYLAIMAFIPFSPS